MHPTARRTRLRRPCSFHLVHPARIRNDIFILVLAFDLAGETTGREESVVGVSTGTGAVFAVGAVEEEGEGGEGEDAEGDADANAGFGAGGEG